MEKPKYDGDKPEQERHVLISIGDARGSIRFTNLKITEKDGLPISVEILRKEDAEKIKAVLVLGAHRTWI